MFAIEMEIARPVCEVFPRLAKIEDSPLWYSAVDSVDRIDPGPTRAGTRFHFRRQLGGNDAVNEVEVTAFEPNRALELTSLSGPTPFVYHYNVEPAGAGTLLRLDGAISGRGLDGPMALLRPLAEAFFRSGMVDNLASLKRLIENDTPVSRRASVDGA